MSREGAEKQQVAGVYAKSVAYITPASGTVKIPVYQTVTYVGNTGACTLELPPIKEAQGKKFAIIKNSADAEIVTVSDRADSRDWSDNTDIDAEHDRQLWGPMGDSWFLFGEHH